MPNRGTDLIGGIAEILDLYVSSKEKERDLYKGQVPDLIEQEQPGGGTKLVEKGVGVDVKQPKVAKRTKSKSPADNRWHYDDAEQELVFPNIKPEVEAKLSESAKNLFKRRDELRELKDRLTLQVNPRTGKTTRIPIDESDWKQEKLLNQIDAYLMKNHPEQYFEFELPQEEAEEDDYRFYDDPGVSGEAKVDSTQDWINQFKRQ